MHPNPMYLLATGLALALTTAAAAQDSAAGSTTSPDGAVMARLVTADGTDAGKVTFQSMRAGMLVQVDLSGLPVGPHAIHIHEIGACEPDFSAAGEHLAPDGHEHGFAQTEAPHAGDRVAVGQPHDETPSLAAPLRGVGSGHLQQAARDRQVVEHHV